MSLKQKLADFIVQNASFPTGYDKRNQNWMLKGVCPVCLDSPIECLSNKEYMEKYPAKYVLNLGKTKVYLCEVHAKELVEKMKKMDEV